MELPTTVTWSANNHPTGVVHWLRRPNIPTPRFNSVCKKPIWWYSTPLPDHFVKVIKVIKVSILTFRQGSWHHWIYMVWPMNGLHLHQNECANCQPNMIKIYNYIKLMYCKTNVNILSACSVAIVIIVTRIATAMVGYITILTVIEYIVNCNATAAVVLSTGSHLQTLCCGIWNMLNLGQTIYVCLRFHAYIK